MQKTIKCLVATLSGPNRTLMDLDKVDFSIYDVILAQKASFSKVEKLFNSTHNKVFNKAVDKLIFDTDIGFVTATIDKVDVDYNKVKGISGWDTEQPESQADGYQMFSYNNITFINAIPPVINDKPDSNYVKDVFSKNADIVVINSHVDAEYSQSVLQNNYRILNVKPNLINSSGRERLPIWITTNKKYITIENETLLLETNAPGRTNIRFISFDILTNQ